MNKQTDTPTKLQTHTAENNTTFAKLSLRRRETSQEITATKINVTVTSPKKILTEK